ncbi:ESPR-type extended signal peptide-containing protein [Dialister invisus]|uniref:ESPR-type extended signal peptide-containing protein n=1 Tax=Dialister invisus TaxID=218538 RepID=UPI0028E89647|nr:ESPR-type extended signal peptide-containing protein [Dialister invisus]
MNKIYKIVWSKAKHAYVVTSEVARSHTKSASGKAVKAVLAATVGMGVLMGGYAADAAPATNPAGNGPGIAIGTGSSAPKVENVAIGQGAGIGYSNGASAATGDVAIGNGANINNYASQGGSIAIGKNAKVENMAGGGEASFAFGQTTFSGSWLSLARIPADPTKVVGSVAIGDNTFARTGSTMIGSHNYKGALGDTTVDSASTRTDALNVYATTIGANSFSNGAFTTSTGAYNIISGDYTGGRSSNAVKNLGATITGSLNSIESKTGSYYSGIANTVSGVANRTFNSNGSLIYGAGNEITNSYTPLYDTPEDGGSSAKAFADKLRKSVRDSKSGGATLAIGGGNKADYTQKTSIIGVNNTVTGTSGSPSTYNSITGYNNTATNINHVSVIGSENNVTNTNGAVVFGDKRTLTGANGSVVIGSSQNGTSTSVKNAVAIGSEANVTKEGGVALGAGSVASVDKGVAGYDPGTGTNSTDTSSVWKSTQAAVSVGDTSKGITRQITGVAAGTNDTDAVNVAQLRKAKTSIVAAASTEVRAGTNITSVNKTADPGDGHAIYTINAKDTVVTGGTATYASNGTGSATLINNDGTTATITGLQDRYTSSASLNGDTLNFTRNDGSTYSVSGIASSQDIKNVTQKVGELGTRVNRVGAGAAALAALHPLDFDPDDKWDVAAGYGNYKDAHAVSVGAFYRPNEDTMFSVGGSFGGGENMVNAGVSVKLGQGNHVSTSRVALAKEVEDLKVIVKAQSAEIKAMRGAMQSGASVMKDVNFPDVPKDHWAYSYVKSLADRGLLEGYPDGEFKGDRSMTRYEFAAIIYRALQNGAPIDSDMAKAIGEFDPEINRIKDLDRTRVDRISGKDNDRNKVERVRVNNESNKEKGDYRDVYGSHISPEA